MISPNRKAMDKSNSKNRSELLRRRDAPLETRTDLKPAATRDISAAMNAILADVFALYVKTKNFHWHMSGRIFAIIICFWTNTPTSFLQ